MSTAGLRRRPHYEEVLNAVHKDAQSRHGIIGVGLQRFATRAVNNPLFQRVAAGIGEQMQGDQRRLLEEQGVQNDVQMMASDQGVSHHDLNWVVRNLQQPTPTPTPVAPRQTEAQADYLRAAAEMDLLAQRRATQDAHQRVADQATSQMSALAVVTPAQQMIRDHHMRALPPLPPPDYPPPDTISAVARSTGQSVQQVHATRTRPKTTTRTRSTPYVSSSNTPSGPSSNTPYGPTNSMAVPAGGFSASSSIPAPRSSARAIQDAPRPTTRTTRGAPAQVVPDTSSASAWSIYAPTRTSQGSQPTARPVSAPLYAPSQTARAGVIAANVQAAARGHLLELARRHANGGPSARELLSGPGKRKTRARNTASILRREAVEVEDHPRSKQRTSTTLDRSRYAQTYNLDRP